MPQRPKARKIVPLWPAIAIVCTVIAAAGGIIFWQARISSRLQAQVAARTAENAEFERRLDQLTRSQTVPEASAPQASAPRSAPHDAGTATATALSASEQRAERMRESLSEATSEVDRLQARVAVLERQMESAGADNRRLTAAAEESKKGLADAQQTIETLRADAKANNARVAQLESLNAKLREEAATGKDSSQIQQTVSDLEGIFRRREMYLNNILRRYREITEHYRAISGVMGSRDHQAATVDAAELSRIQNSIGLTEDDLKQIGALDAQASRLEKKLRNAGQ